MSNTYSYEVYTCLPHGIDNWGWQTILSRVSLKECEERRDRDNRRDNTYFSGTAFRILKHLD